MNAFLLDTKTYDELYNCSFYDFNTRSLNERRHLVLGILYIVTSFVLLTIYTPCLLIFMKKDYISQSCYKLMLYIGITDYILLILNGLLTGFLGVFGVVYCQYPKQMYIIGSIGISLWCCQSIATIILAINRCLEMWNRTLTLEYFGGKRTYLWLVIPTAYACYVFTFTTPAAFSPFVMAWLFDPHTGYFDDQNGRYVNKVHAPNNIFVATVLPLLYTIFIIFFRRKYKTMNLSTVQVFKTQRQVKQTFIQVFIICLFTFCICMGYLVIQRFPLPVGAVFVTQYAWILYSGSPAVIYLTLNQTIRKSILKTFVPKKYQPTIAKSLSISNAATKASPMPSQKSSHVVPQL